MQEKPLSGIRILEFAGIGPGPFCGMLLSDVATVSFLTKSSPGHWKLQLLQCPVPLTRTIIKFLHFGQNGICASHGRKDFFFSSLTYVTARRFVSLSTESVQFVFSICVESSYE